MQKGCFCIGILAARFKANRRIHVGTLECPSSYSLSLSVSALADWVEGDYPGFKFDAGALSHACFYRNYLIDFANKQGGVIQAEVEVHRRDVSQPICDCKKVCNFCDHDCKLVGYDGFVEESVFIDLHGIRFFGRSRLKKLR